MLVNTYRPKTFDNLVGNPFIVEFLKKLIVKKDKLPSGIILHGPFGTGKTSIARIFSKALLCNNIKDFNPCGICDSCISIEEGNSLNYIEEDSASNSKVENIEKIIEESRLSPLDGSNLKIFVLDECHILSQQAQTKLLKTMEEGIKHCFFILVTTHFNKIIDTIKSRVFNLKFEHVSPLEIKKRLKFICESEKITFEEDALDIIIGASKGHVRDAVKLLEQYTVDSCVNLKTCQGLESKTLIDYSIKLLFKLGSDLSKSLEILDFLLKDYDLQQIYSSVLKVCSTTLILKATPNNLNTKNQLYFRLYSELGDNLHNCFDFLKRNRVDCIDEMKTLLIILSNFIKGSVVYNFDNHVKTNCSNIDSKLRKRSLNRKNKSLDKFEDIISPNEFAKRIGGEFIKDEN